MPNSLPAMTGRLFTPHVLADAIPRMPLYLALDDTAVEAFAEDLQCRFAAIARGGAHRAADDLIRPVLDRLGWSDALRRQSAATSGGVIIDTTDRPLDRRTAEGRAAPSTRMLHALRRGEDLSGTQGWGILTNGRRWRLYFQGARSVAHDVFDIDLAAVLETRCGDHPATSRAERIHCLRLFATIFRHDAFLPAAPSNTTFHLHALELGRTYETRVVKALSSLLRERVFPSLVRTIAGAAPDAALPAVREAGLIQLYRLLFVINAQDRGLLPPPACRVRETNAASTPRSRHRAVVDAMTALSGTSDPSTASCSFSCSLFGADRAPLLDRVRIDDALMVDLVDSLTFDRSSGAPLAIDYRDLSVQQLGSIYERLLDLDLTCEGSEICVRLDVAARKTSGSYYTPDDLVRLLVRATLDPLIEDHVDAFRRQAEALAKDVRPAAPRLADLAPFDIALRLLGLKVCDPAMGSGHILVGLVDYLTDRVIAALAEAEAIVDWGDYVSPLVPRLAAIRDARFSNAAPGNQSLERIEDHHIIRRLVLERCIHGVDKAPLAVDIAKAALWLHASAPPLPLSFLDHHLRAGDSLFGAWIGGTRTNILKRGGTPSLLHRSLGDATEAATDLREIEARLGTESVDARVGAHSFAGLRMTMEPLDRFMAIMHAFDWLKPTTEGDRAAIRSWLNGAFGDPVGVASGAIRLRTSDVDAARFATLLAAASTLASEQRFLNWQLAFPNVWKDWDTDDSSGFDAVVGNPPWDRMKLQQVEWFAARRPDIARSTRAADRMRKTAALAAADESLAQAFGHAAGLASTAARVARDGGDYPQLSSGDINLYALFVERAMRLTRRDGIIGLLIPSGIAFDKSAAPFFRSVVTEGRLEALYDFENRRTRFGKEPFFPGVDSRFKFCAFIASPQRRFPLARCGFFLQATREIADPDRVFPIAASDFSHINPNTGTAAAFTGKRDADLVIRLHRTVPVLADHRVCEQDRPWKVRYHTMFHMTADSRLFRTAEELMREGWDPTPSRRWRKGGAAVVPLYSGRMFHQFDHRAAGVTMNDRNLHNPARSEPATAADKGDPSYCPMPQFWVPWDAVQPKRGWSLAFRDVARPTDARTLIAAMLPGAAYGNKAPLLLTDDAESATLLLGNLNAFVLDFVARAKIQSANANWFIIQQLPILPPSAYDRIFCGESARDIIRRDVVALSYTAHDLAPYALSMDLVDNDGTVSPPVVWDEDDRARRRARLDALYFHLYDVSYDEADHILSTFPIIRRQDEAVHGRFVTRDRILNQMHALSAGERSGVTSEDAGAPRCGGEPDRSQAPRTPAA